ncbi:hypothetical protein [Pseudomonas sp. LB3P14]
MKTKLLVRKSTAHCVDSPAQLEQMLLSGDWLLASPLPKARGKDARRMCNLRRDRRLAGWQSLYLWLTPEQAALVEAAKWDNETYVDLLIRLITERSLLK